VSRRARGVGAYGFTVTVSPFFLAASSKFPAMSRGERSLMDKEQTEDLQATVRRLEAKVDRLAGESRHDLDTR
jgi:hypothetical protein